MSWSYGQNFAWRSTGSTTKSHAQYCHIMQELFLTVALPGPIPVPWTKDKYGERYYLECSHLLSACMDEYCESTETITRKFLITPW